MRFVVAAYCRRLPTDQRAPEPRQEVQCERLPSSLLPPRQREGQEGQRLFAIKHLLGLKTFFCCITEELQLLLCHQVLKLLITAWDRRLIFTIGTSSTTGESDTVVWNEIHHKTEFGSNLTGHGYPDPNYLDNVLTELSAQGVGEDNLKD